MVKVFNKAGKHIFNEPPYTEEEERDFYRRLGGGPKVIVHAPRPAPEKVQTAEAATGRPTAGKITTHADDAQSG